MNKTFEIIKEIGAISKSSDSRRELNLVSWNGCEAVLDIRSWSSDRSSYSRGIGFDDESARKLMTILTEYFEEGYHLPSSSDGDAPALIFSHLGTIYEDGYWSREVNIVSWYGNAPKLDIRRWSNDRMRCTKGATFYEAEAKTLLKLLSSYFAEKERRCAS